MGQSQLPISPTSQQLQLSVAAVAATTPTSYSPTNVLAGSATFTFQSVPDGQHWTGSLTIADASSQASFQATVGATPIGAWGGPTVFGPIQLVANQQLVVTAAGLNPGDSYVCVLTGANDNVVPAPTWPDANSSSLSVQSGSLYDTLSTTSGLGWSYVSFATAFTFVATRTYQGLSLNIGNVGGAVTSALTANVYNEGQGNVGKAELIQRKIPVGSQPAPASSAWTLYFPITINSGDIVAIWFNGVSAQWTGNSVWLPFGYYNPPATQITNVPQQALNVVSYGGLQYYITGQLTTGSTANTLSAPPAGYAYRVHSFGSNLGSGAANGPINLADSVGQIGGFNLVAAGGVFSGSQQLNGTLASGALNVSNFSGVTVAIWTRYDLVEFPGII